ncbi:hypothetical protein LB452_09380 [Psychroflexus sp. CAK8W]|uniref:Carboxypeptidase regulatory-like domain-containing protein n=1 Tax=Psychroflexus longus TaxID=2873596 RepID=A0ABS7XJK5_9FLAO|nr:hypothetical protein [Psychroflexus longus]MBZ9779135.1 hypothetical protein [Psychroflexus longus]
MKNVFVVIILIFSVSTFGQRVLIKGVAIDTFENKSAVQISVNDTRLKRFSSDLSKYDKQSEIKKNEDLFVKTDENGYFEIEVKLTDSLFFKSWKHIIESYLVSDLFKRDSVRIELKPKVCTEYIPCDEKPRMLYAFIGKKIKVELADEIFYCNIIPMDPKYKAKYEILENLHGEYAKDTINFVSYDHASIERYDDYDNVLIYVADYCGELIHVKYQYHELFKTIDGKWASPYNPHDYRKIDSTFHVKPRRIKFEKPVVIEFKKENLELIEEKYPEPYYEIKNGKVKILYGNYPNELFELKKSTILKDRGFFD